MVRTAVACVDFVSFDDMETLALWDDDTDASSVSTSVSSVGAQWIV